MAESSREQQAAALRRLPSVSRLIGDPEVVEIAGGLRPDVVVALARTHIGRAREATLAGEIVSSDALVRGMLADLRSFQSPSPTVINGTGVIIQTNLGRAPVSSETAEAMRMASGRYVPLETRLDTGERGGRGDDISAMMRVLTGAERTLVVNNNAAAVLLMLSALCSNQEVVVSRGEAVEIGGGFRVPDVMRQSGATLVEVGTTNRTYVADYERAVTESTAAFLRVHASNFTILGFAASPTLADVVAGAKRHDLFALEDVGSGCLVDTSEWGLAHEPTLAESIEAGVDVVCASGDKLLGGPQAGLILGRSDVVERVARHPLARAVRADKTALAGITATLRHYLRGDATERIPVWWSISRSPEWLETRARGWQLRLGDRTSVVASEAVVGGGSLPGKTLPSYALVIDPLAEGASTLARRLRTGRPSVFPRVDDGVVIIDARTVLQDEDDALVSAVRGAIA